MACRGDNYLIVLNVSETLRLSENFRFKVG